MGKRAFRQLSYEAQAATLQQKAQLLQSKAQKKWIDEQLKTRYDLIPAVVQHLRSLGCKAGAGQQQPHLDQDATSMGSGPRTPSKSSAAGSSGMPGDSQLEGDEGGEAEPDAE